MWFGLALGALSSLLITQKSMSLNFLSKIPDFYWNHLKIHFLLKVPRSIIKVILEIIIKTLIFFLGGAGDGGGAAWGNTQENPSDQSFDLKKKKRYSKKHTKHTSSNSVQKLWQQCLGERDAYRSLLGDSLLSGMVSGSALVKSIMWFLKWQMAFKPMKSCILKAHTSILTGGQA